MIIPIYRIAGDLNDLTRQYAWKWQPAQIPLLEQLYGILTAHGPRIYVYVYVYKIGTFANVIIFTSTINLSRTHLTKSYFTNASTVIATGIFVLIHVSDEIWLNYISQLNFIPISQNLFWSESYNMSPIWFMPQGISNRLECVENFKVE